MTDPTVSTETITPDDARRYLGFNTHNRNLRARVVSGYARDMKSGNWRWNGETIKIATDGTLLDGQHRLAAIVEAETAVDMLVIRGLPNLAQETMDAGAKRTLGDVLKLRGEANVVPLASTIRGVAGWLAGARGTSMQFPNAELLQTLEQHRDIRLAVSPASRAYAATALPVGVGGTARCLFSEIHAADADHFFDRLASDEDHHAGEPVHALRKLLLSQRETRGERNRKVLLAVPIKAWNKYGRGRPAPSCSSHPEELTPNSSPNPASSRTDEHEDAPGQG